MEKFKCAKCGLTYTDQDNLWCPGDCPACGWSPKTAARLSERAAKARAQAAAQSRRERARQIQAENKAHPLYGFCIRLTEYLARKYAGEVEFIPDVAIMANIQGGEHARTKSGRSYIRYGYEATEFWYEHGFDEMASWQWIWNHQSLKGYGALWQLVLHEFAHALQNARNGRWYGAMHTQIWADAVQELQREVPLDLALAIAKK